MKKKKQPEIKKGTTFTGWATFNWGMSHDRVYRTRKEAKQSCLNRSLTKQETWDDVKNHMMVKKVKCVVL